MEWTTKDELLLASLAIEHNEQWLAVKSSIRSFIESDRSTDILPNHCAAKYEKLKEEDPELALFLRGRSKRHSQVSDPTIYRQKIYRKLAERRLDELRKDLPEKRKTLLALKSDLELLRSAKASPQDRARIEKKVQQMREDAEETRRKDDLIVKRKKENNEDDKNDDEDSNNEDRRLKDGADISKVSEDKVKDSKEKRLSGVTPIRAATRRETKKTISDLKDDVQDESRASDVSGVEAKETDPATEKLSLDNNDLSTKSSDAKPIRATTRRETRKTTLDLKDEVKDDSRASKVTTVEAKETEKSSLDANDSMNKSSDNKPIRATTRRESNRQQSESNKQSIKRVMAMILRDTKKHENIKLLDKPDGQSDMENYNSVIYKPIDLADLQKKMEKWDNPIELLNNLLLMFQNACMFYPESHPTHQAALKMRSELSTRWELAMKEFLPTGTQSKEGKMRPRERR